MAYYSYCVRVHLQTLILRLFASPQSIRTHLKVPWEQGQYATRCRFAVFCHAYLSHL